MGMLGRKFGVGLRRHGEAVDSFPPLLDGQSAVVQGPRAFESLGGLQDGGKGQGAEEDEKSDWRPAGSETLREALLDAGEDTG